MNTQTMPKALILAALKKQASIGREYDSAGNHVAYWYRAPGSDWKNYRSTAAGLLAVLRRV